VIINQLRTYLSDRTTSRVFVNGERNGSALEDVGRPAGVKVKAQTCIPEGTYWVARTHSPKFNRPMLILFNVVSDMSIRDGKIQYTGVRIHSGENIDHTDACVLYGKEIKDGKLVKGGLETLEDLIDTLLKSGAEVLWIISEDAA